MKVLRLRWMRRYKTCFIIGILILFFQLFIAVRFIGSSNWNSTGAWQYRGTEQKVSVDNKNLKKTNVIDKKNNTVLRLDELDFTPSCEISGKEAVSAIHRAKSQRCKQLIANVTCLSLKGLLYPKKLPSLCPHIGFRYGKDLGCFKDQRDFRILPGYLGVNKKDNSPQYCIQLCLQSGFSYAGVQYSSECFCGHDEPPSTAKIADSSCNMKCPGDDHTTCGGVYTMNVYETGIKRFIPQIAHTGEEQLGAKTKIVFLLTVSGRAVRQVKRLIKILYRSHHYFYIHVDIRQDYMFKELLPLESEFTNIRLTRHRFATIWGGASLLTMLLSCMKELLKLNWNWDFVLNLSESDYPVKSIEQLENFLANNKNFNFVKSHGREVQRFIQKQGLDKTFVECDTHMWRVADRQLPKEIQIDGGSDWVALSRPFVSYVAKEKPDYLVSGLLIVFQHTLLPAESFFHTVLRNSIFCDSYVDNNLHVTNWKRKLGCKCQYKHVVDWCGCSPNDFRPEDWPKILNTETRQLYFARKFEPIVNQAVILQLELWLHSLNSTPVIVTNINSYWQNIYHYQDLGSSPEDGLLTISRSAVRSWIHSISNNSCAITLGNLLQVTSYHVKDNYKYTLVNMNLKVNTKSLINIELAFKPLNKLFIIKRTKLTRRLEQIIVSSEYDQKEQLCRNFARILSPFSDFTLLFKFSVSDETSVAQVQNLTFLWIDPVGRVVEVSEVSLDENSVIGHIKPAFKQPHLPGSWTIKLIDKTYVLAELKFLVTPLEIMSGNKLTQNQVNSVHGGSSVIKNWRTNYEQFLDSNFDRDILKRVSLNNSYKYGDNLIEWIDALFGKFFSVENICSIGSSDALCSQELPPCKESKWSSFSPDSKSAISKNMLNQTTGRFHIW